MNSYLLLFFLSFSLLSNAQNQTKIKFSYDNAGNQISRTLCVNCPPETGKQVKEIEAIVEEDLEKIEGEEMISYYPNPVKEELYLKWELTDDNYVTSIQLISLAGQVLNTFRETKKNNSQNILFQSYPSGVYVVLVNYKSGDPKTIKIIKQ
ncbi:T9SS C-terminal target domain-containing protein [Flavobacterium cheongpyeongense]|uniref:T9SS C-terminal target domain-containing protein n=1 Tax=Flavobacterium cheongpyeongense TaxID=2212651 RepID=A0A2V4BUV6_9FLAO|nr:T9SS type A sorting domain-containing protein [Flavobacterium cheongpyeongense]PXY42775.1 T9SS C-terminal target domain-containing protein [Flavobacterium cheongpyeongense]